MSRMSREEKRAKLLQVFHEGREFYQLKELEKSAKEKNLNQNQVKEILQALVDDELVDSEKFGSTVFYWSFPNKVLKSQRKKREDLRATKKEIDDKLVTLEAALKAEQETQNDFDKLKRDQLSKEIVSLEEQERDLLEFIKQNEEMDPEKAVKFKAEAKELLEAGNRWVDNIFVMQRWCVNRFNIEEKAINKQFNIPDDLDYKNE